MTRGIDSYPGQFGNPPGVRFLGGWYNLLKLKIYYWKALELFAGAAGIRRVARLPVRQPAFFELFSVS
jgi:hypothetical protein